jgi:predicted ATPase/DNA-binding SARP family transcriptional activator
MLNTNQSRLSLALLGPVQMQHNGQPVSFAYDKVQALLIYLAVEHGRAHRRTSLAALLWPEQDEAAARHSLSQALFSLRRTLADDSDAPMLLVTRDTLRLNPHVSLTLDLTTFQALLRDTTANRIERLQQASALYCGDFLEDFSVSTSSAFEDWVLFTREQLRRQASDMLQQLSEPGSQLGLAQRCDYARRWILLDPLNEEAHRRLMHALADSGQKTAALSQFEHCRKLLEDELGLEPEAATSALYEEIKRSSLPPPTVHRQPHREVPRPPTTRLIGRDQDRTLVSTLVNDPGQRLITITGPGGVGKTRLALAVAEHSSASFSDGLCFVPLAPVQKATSLLGRLAQALGVQQHTGTSLADLIHTTLADRQMLLLLDNCEHLMPDIAVLVADLLIWAPQLVILATSRTALRISQEYRYPLAPLSVTDHHHLAQSAAVALFIERAQAVRPNVELDLEAISAICRRLDGLPLAIELAATRTRMLQPGELLARLEQPLTLLRSDVVDLPARQQTLHATIEWSYQLLEPAQQALFSRLAVFADGWTVTSAEQVCASLDISNGTSILDGLTGLFEASLISEISHQTDEPRFTMLATIREFAYEQLVMQGALVDTQVRHATAFLALGANAADALKGSQQLPWLQRIDDELGNLRATLNWCMGHNVSAGLQLASNLLPYWSARGYRIEGRDWLEQLLELPSNTGKNPSDQTIRAHALHGVGMLAMYLHDLEHATLRTQQSLDLYQQLEHEHGIGRALNNLGNIALQQGAYATAERYYQQSLAIRRTINDSNGMAACLNNLGEVARHIGDLAAARGYFDESLARYQEGGNIVAAASVNGHIATLLLQQCEYGQAEQRYQASYQQALALGDKPGQRQTLNGLGTVAFQQGRYQEAKTYYRQSIQLAVEIAHIGAVALSVFLLATVAWAEEQAGHAAVLLSAFDALNRSARLSHEPHTYAQYDEYLALIRTALAPQHFANAWQSGQALTVEQMVAIAGSF